MPEDEDYQGKTKQPLPAHATFFDKVAPVDGGLGIDRVKLRQRAMPLLRSTSGRRAGAILSVLSVLAAFPASADDFSDGTTAFKARDYRTAAAMWQRAADKGSPEAKLQLGLLAERGLGMPPDPVKAFQYYQEAAQLGLAEGAVKVGAMLDSGTGVARDSVAAGVWYARAAIAGSDRAAFQLGLKYQDGNGVPVNNDLADYWLKKALHAPPAAKGETQQPSGADSKKITAPMPLDAVVVTMTGQPIADLVWTAKPASQSSLFAVQVLSNDGADRSETTILTEETVASALQVPVPQGRALWRVARIDPATDDYQASPWQHQIGEPPDPEGLVSIIVNPGDGHAADVARKFAGLFKLSGLVVQVRTATKPAKSSTIQYRYRQDAKFAQDVAALLPGFSSDLAVQARDLVAGPGEVVVNLVLAPPISR